MKAQLIDSVRELDESMERSVEQQKGTRTVDLVQHFAERRAQLMDLLPENRRKQLADLGEWNEDLVAHALADDFWSDLDLGPHREMMKYRLPKAIFAWHKSAPDDVDEDDVVGIGPYRQIDKKLAMEALHAVDAVLTVPAPWGQLSQVLEIAEVNPRFFPPLSNVVSRSVFDVIDNRIQLLYQLWIEKNLPTLEVPNGTPLYVTLCEVLEKQTQPVIGKMFAAIDIRNLAERFRVTPRAVLAALQNGPIKLLWLDVRHTYHCNIACRHCFMHGSPFRSKLRIDADQTVEFVKQMPAANLPRLLIGAGEPFLHLPTLVAGIAEARRLNIPGISLVTNGFWGKNLEKARDVAKQLADAGFYRKGSNDRMKLSTGLYHIEAGVPVQSIANAARAVFEATGRKVLVDWEVDQIDGELTIDEACAEMEKCGAIEESYDLKLREVSPVGAGAELEGLRGVRPLESFRACTGVDKVAIEPDGRLRPCCGANHLNDGLVNPGNAFNMTVPEMAKSIVNNPINQILQTRPMCELGEILQRPINKDGYTGRCELCQDMLGNIKGQELIDQMDRLVTQTSLYPHWFIKQPATVRRPS
ncbi:MAG: radical SAM protein [Deltaproteobacteria bacterium]|nr:radical SAM protein [Deltaproteobacteria bacterium]